MERAKRPYSIQKRPSAKKNRHVYYVQFRHPETGVYMTAGPSPLPLAAHRDHATLLRAGDRGIRAGCGSLIMHHCAAPVPGNCPTSTTLYPYFS